MVFFQQPNDHKETLLNMVEIQQVLAELDLELQLTRKKVKNINFRITIKQLKLSVPHYVSEADIIYSLNKRLSWIINAHNTLIQEAHIQPIIEQDSTFILWGEKQHLEVNLTQKLVIYRSELQEKIPELFKKWQLIVGQSANEYRIKKMKTRWGSCNIQAKRVWLSVYLPAYPLECTEYVIVHELCHLHHANHSAQFWDEVKKAMPDYKKWHDMLANKYSDYP